MPPGRPPPRAERDLAGADGRPRGRLRGGCAACLEGEQLRIEPPGSDTPTIFRTYPLSGSARYALPVVIHAEFAVNEERREIYLGTDEKEVHHNRGKVSLALSLLPPLAAAGVRLSWGRAHLLARVQPIACDDEAARWWRQELAKTAGRLAREPLVLLDEDGAVPALTDEEGADDPVFPLPLLMADDPQDEPFSPIWSLMEAVLRLRAARGRCRGLATHRCTAGRSWASKSATPTRSSSSSPTCVASLALPPWRTWRINFKGRRTKRPRGSPISSR